MSRSWIQLLLLLSACANAQPQLNLCANQYGQQIPCTPGQSGASSSNQNHHTASSAGTAAAVSEIASVAVNVGAQIGRIGNAFDMIGEIEANRARRYAPQSQPETLSPEEFRQQTEQNNRENQNRWRSKEQHLAKLHGEDYEHMFRNLDEGINRLKASLNEQSSLILQSTPDSKTGSVIREYIKRELIRESSGHQRDDILWELLLEADRLSSERLLNRAIKYYRYRLGGSYTTDYRSQKLPERIKSEFALGNIDASTFEGSEIIEIAQELDKHSQIFENEFLKLHTAITLKTAEESALNHDHVKFFSSIDKAWACVDYARGVIGGFKDFAYDTAEGIGQMILHPIDSAEALYNALVDYDKTYDAIKTSLELIWDGYDTYSLEEKGHLHAQIAGEVLATLFPVGNLKNIAKVSKSIEQVVSDTRKLQRIGNYFPAPSKLTAFPKIWRVDPKTPVQSGCKLRRRWKDSDGKIYEWDHRHGTVEVYDKRGRHLGEFDSESGIMVKQNDLGRRVEP